MQGLTLIELLVAVAILGVTLGLVAPAFRQMTLAVRANGVFHELTASLAMARTHSLMRNAPVVVCPSQDGVTCRHDSVWDQGWIAFTARDGRLVRASSGGRGLVITSNRPRLRFQAGGFSEGSNLTLYVYADADGPLIGVIKVSQAGRIRSERTPMATISSNSP
ncbi:GspH/FimT family pseudopilin [Lysobacter arenosi]|uniref:Type II secretion system protein H n=1 Tax=Lysobacter arenosi TaxID=2795387 RepID=A0ABX7RAL4_9GAMM|nr:GspH/FimT family pseudopilin [Lysobacter arenosi]QSX75159.1 GspH/FimT family pseudopilin [Lysobacter arenosi]